MGKREYVTLMLVSNVHVLVCLSKFFPDLTKFGSEKILITQVLSLGPFFSGRVLKSLFFLIVTENIKLVPGRP
jgi:hypothetical protein